MTVWLFLRLSLPIRLSMDKIPVILFEVDILVSGAFSCRETGSESEALLSSDAMRSGLHGLRYTCPKSYRTRETQLA